MAGGTTNVYRVHFHMEQGGKKVSMEQIEYVSSADAMYNTIKTVLNNNNKLLGGGTFVIDAVHNLGLGAVLIA